MASIIRLIFNDEINEAINARFKPGCQALSVLPIDENDHAFTISADAIIKTTKKTSLNYHWFWKSNIFDYFKNDALKSALKDRVIELKVPAYKKAGVLDEIRPYVDTLILLDRDPLKNLEVFATDHFKIKYPKFNANDYEYIVREYLAEKKANEYATSFNFPSRFL